MLFIFYIGIGVDVDVGKFKYYACVISSESEVLIEPFFLPDNLENFESFF